MAYLKKLTEARLKKEGWERVMFAAECDPDGDGWCQVRDVDPAECDCIRPTEEGVEYREVDGVLYGKRIAKQ